MRCSAAPRVTFEQPVALVGDDHFSCQATALNLCCAGMFVRAEVTEPIPPRLRVRFELPGGASIDALARVVRVSGPGQSPDPSGPPSERESLDPPGIALCFESLSEDNAQSLDSFIARRLESTAGERVHLTSGAQHDEEHDPVLTQAFAEHVRSHEQWRLRAAEASARYGGPEDSELL